MLSAYRVLDLASEGASCGWMLAELGADVICIEPPGGSPARQRGPFADDVRDPERSLHWWAWARGKRSVELDLDSDIDRETLRELAASADVLIESGYPGELAYLGLGYERLAERNPGLVYVSITPFGQDGPKADWAATDLTVLAAGGPLWLYGDDDRAPVRVSVPQAFEHAGAEAGAAALVALHERHRSGRGQHVDVSAQQAVTLATQSDIVAAAVGEPGASRFAGGAKMGPLSLRFVFPASDGHVSITFVFGSAIGPASARLMKLVHAEGFCDEEMAGKDWVGIIELILTGKDTFDTIKAAADCVAAWTGSKTKAELLEIAMERDVLIAPVSTPRDVVESEQLAARSYFEAVERPDGAGETRQPGPFARFGAVPRRTPRRAPRIGEHTDEVRAELASRKTRELEGDASSGELPLAGVTVLDFMWAIAGPMSTRMLADYGATVIRVESAKMPDACRTMRPFAGGAPGLETSTLFHSCNAGKRTIALDLTNPEARAVVLDLTRKADIVCESFRPGTMKKLGFDYDSLRQAKPDLIMLSTCLMGQTGPLATYAGYGNLAAAITGFFEMTGWPDRDPAGPFAAYTDYIAPKFNAAAMLAALEHRRRTGEGQHIDLSQAETALHFLGPAVLDVLVNDRVPTRAGNRDDRYAPHGGYPTAGEDQWLTIAVADDAGWRDLCDELGAPELARDERFANAAARMAEADALDARLAELTAERDGAELEAKLQTRGIAAHRVQNSPACVADPQLQARGHFVEIGGEDDRSVVENTRSRLSRTPSRVGPNVPTLGRDTHEILEQMLGYDGERITELVIAGVLE